MLILLLATAQLWVNRHLGSLNFDWWGVSAAIGAIVAGFKFLDRYLTPAEKKDLKGAGKWVNAATRWLLLSPPFLGLLGLLLVLTMLTWSSIQVVGDDGKPIESLEVAPVGGTTAGPVFRSNGRTLVPVTPFGHPYWLEVPGYRPRVVVTPPLTGIVLQASRDLRRSSTVLLRMPYPGLTGTPHGARFRLWRGSQPLADTTGAAGAWMFGPPVGVNTDRMAIWRLELSVGEVAENVIANALLRWRRPMRLNTRGIYLMPGDSLMAEICLPKGPAIARGWIRVDEDDPTDVQLPFLGPGTECSP